MLKIDVSRGSDNEVWRLAASDWARANGLDPDSIPAESVITVDEAARTITAEVWERDDGGKLVLDKENPNRVATRTVTVPLVTDFPEPLR
jgi:hypothetical protein